MNEWVSADEVESERRSSSWLREMLYGGTVLTYRGIRIALVDECLTVMKLTVDICNQRAISPKL